MKLSIIKTGTGRVLCFVFTLAVLIAGSFTAHADEASVWRKYAADMKSEAADARKVAAGVIGTLPAPPEGDELVRDLVSQAKSYLGRGDDFADAADRAMDVEKYQRAYRLYNTAKVYFTGSATAGLNAKSIIHSLDGPGGRPATPGNGDLYTTQEAIQ